MFSGAFPHSVDAKGRLVLPARFRVQVGVHLTLTKGLHRCLWLFPEETWSRLLSQLGGETLSGPDTLALQRFFLGSAVDAGPDDQGRIALPPLLREYAGIDKEVVTVRMGNRLEVWARDRWDAYQNELTDDMILELTARLSFQTFDLRMPLG
jgi:MraZ protein